MAAAAFGSAAVALIGLAVGPFRRFNGDYRLTVTDAPDGLRLRSGLVETSAETIPRGRIQAISMIEPLAWRPFGWCRLEVDVASQKSKGRQDRNQAKAARALLPVGSREQAASLVASVFPGLPAAATRAAVPRALEVAAALSLALVGSERALRRHDERPRPAGDRLGAAGEGAEHPPARRSNPASLRLSSIHLDTAGRRVHAVVRDRDGTEAAALLAKLPDQCRQARQLEENRGSGQTAVPGPL